MKGIIMENKLQVLVKESGLEESKAKYILENFQNYFEIADEWANKAKNIVVTDASQEVDMQMARTGRLFLREKRIAVEKSRKSLKEQALREGKAIDGIANVLKALIIPIEEYLEKQEKFVEIQEEKKRELVRLEVEKRLEEERIAKEKAEIEEQIRIRKEVEKLKEEAIVREKKAEAEREKAEEARIKAEVEQRKVEEKGRIERQKLEEEQRIIKETAQKEREKAEAKAEKDRVEKERLRKMLENQVECPNCHHKFQIKEGQHE